MTTALPEPTAERPAPGVLTFAAPRRAKPPRHLADLTVAERADAVAALGEKPFRAAAAVACTTSSAWSTTPPP